MTVRRYQWSTPGDVNAFFGLMLDNIANLVLTVGLLEAAFKFPVNFALRHMVPGTALGVLVGDLLFTWMAFRLARRTGRNDITAMPLGLDTPSTFGMVFFVLGPAFLAAKARGLDEHAAALSTWQVGACCIILSGVFKMACAFASGWARQVLPRAGLLGSLAAIALVLISFLPLLEILQFPLVGFLSLAVILAALVARVELPGRLPGALGALVVGGVVYYVMHWSGALESHAAKESLPLVWLPLEWTESFRGGWLASLRESLQYMPIVIPFDLATVVGGIDCTESAAAAGDEYNTGRIIAVEAFATLVAGFSGGVIQSTPYIGHPAYKAMGGRAAYTLATALFVGSAGMLGYFSLLYEYLPTAAIFPILIFVGLEITAQSFQATPRRHYAAVAFACVPAMASLVLIFADGLLSQVGREIDSLASPLREQLQTVRMLSSGFIITSVLWASALAALIDRRLRRAAVYFGIAGVCSLFGIIHSPLAGSPLVVPWDLPELPKAAANQTPWHLAGGYAGMAVLLLCWEWWRPQQPHQELPNPAARSTSDL
ncbi:MAG: permease [Planctomycetes bacterium]|nr:permease [Planctomycetota bacterium]